MNVMYSAAEGKAWKEECGCLLYTSSLLHADKSPLGLADEHIETEKMLADSGIVYTLLRNGWYTERCV